jgi:predicted methyltransferase MtxX (methanogen marker protein 4)
MASLLEMIDQHSREARVSVGIGSATAGDAADISAASAEEEGLGPVDVLTGAEEIVEAIDGQRYDAVVRGTLPANDVIPRLLEQASITSARRAALVHIGVEDAFLLAPVGIDEGDDAAARWQLLQDASELAMSLGSKARVAVMSKGREEDAGRGVGIARSIRECHELRDRALERGYEAECVGILLERAVGTANVVIAPDGVAGNLVFRSLHYVAGNESWGALAMGLLPLVYVDTSRGKDDFIGAIRFARAIAHAL